YVIVPAPRQVVRHRRRGRFPGLSGFGRRRQARYAAETLEQAAQTVTLRTESLSQQLAACGLSCHRLTSTELATLAYTSLTPERALAHPLTARTLARVGRPITHTRRRR